MARKFRLFLMVLSAIIVLGFGGDGGARASGLTTLYSFCADFQKPTCIDGATPASRLLQVGDALYGTTYAGGSGRFGTLFRISTSGRFTSVYSFCQKTSCSDGSGPGNYLTPGPHGDVYGVTVAGGKADGGTIFKQSQGKLSIIYRFCPNAGCADGVQPVSVVFDSGGILFGTTSAGGSHGAGVAFTVDSGSALHVLHNFCSAANCADGIQPGALILGKDGNFYGVTSAGGKNQAGTVFRMTPAGDVTTLHDFCSEKACADGEQPTTTLALGKDGNFYGSTGGGGANSAGTIFRITPAGVWDTLHAFCGNAYCYDGSGPANGLTLAKDGSFYGATSAGGRFYHGLVFHLTTAGDYSAVYDFCAARGCFDGAAPYVAPTLTENGFLYGVTSSGGDKDNVGTIYQLKP
jgi:uncharacterized repeat protein (TIGR03803 family)